MADAPSIDDLMAQTRALTTPQQQGPSVDDLMAQTRAVIPGAAAVVSTTTPAQKTPTAGGPATDERPGQYSPAGSAQAANLGTPGTPVPIRQAAPSQPEPNPLEASASRLGSAVSSGWQSSALAPGAQARLESVPYVGNALGYVSRGLGAGVAGAGQAFQEAQRGVSAAGALIDPALGRDLAGPGLVTVATFAGAPEVAALRAPVRAQFAETRAANAAPLSPEFRAAPIAPEASTRMAGREPGVTEPSGVPGAGEAPNPKLPVSVSSVAEPQGVGADVTRDPSATGAGQPTRGAVLRNLENSVNQSAEDRLNPQGVDHTVYVDGIPPRLLASRDFSTTRHALDEKVARGEDTAFRDELDKNTKDRNTGMVDLLRRDAGDANLLEQAKEARREASPDNFGAFDGERAVDASGLLKAVDDALASASAKRGAIKSALEDVRNSLFDQGGNLETMPSRLYGARQNLTDLLDRSKGIGDEAKKLQAATAILEGMRPLFDDTITAGAPKYAGYMAEYRRLSQPVNQMEFLQKYTEGTTGKKVTGSDGYLIPNRVQSMLNDILQGQKQRGPHSAQALTDQQIQNIINVRNELAAGQLKDRNASVKGSDTFQQLRRHAQGPGVLRAAARETAGVAGNVLAWHLAQTPELNAAIAGIQHGVMPVVRATRQEQKLARANALIAARRQELLTPGPTNQLGQY